MWYGSLGGFIKISILKPSLVFESIVFMSIDCGIIWNHLGGIYPELNSWVWCFDDKDKIIQYLNYLFNHNILPILHTNGASNEVIDQILTNFKYPIPVIKNIQVDQLSLDILTANDYLFNRKPYIYTIGVDSTIGVRYSFDRLGFNPLKRLDLSKAQLLILMGQQSSGKTTIANKLKELGWIVIDEKTCLSIRRLYPLDCKVINQFKQIMSNKDSKIVIDTVNKTVADRMFYIKIAQEFQIYYTVGWVSIPGYDNNSRRKIKTPVQSLHNYQLKLELPTKEENYIQLV